jgi:hypothetical protein
LFSLAVARIQHVIQFIKESKYTVLEHVQPTGSLRFHGKTPGSFVRQNNELKNNGK